MSRPPSVRAVRVALVHLGCARNLIDLGRLGAEGYALVGAVAEADVALLNTCSFIGEARAESEEAISDLLARKKAGQLKGVVVAGCLPQKFRGEVEARFPEVDAFLGLSDYSNVARVVEEVLKGRKVREESGGRAPQGQGEFLRLLQTPRSYAYLRPSHGCDHECAFCIIPQIRGKQASKPLATVVEEARLLTRQGVREIVLVAEDTTGYGTDLGPDAPRLPELLEALAGGVEGLRWLRVMYAYPNAFPWRLVEVMNRFPEIVVPYLDIPVQHGASAVLKSMRRGGTRESVSRIFARLRAEVPGITLRTTVLVGHPGEGAAEFAELLDFLREQRFDRLGAFAFSPEATAPAGAAAGRCSPEEAQERLDQVMRLQAEIAFAEQRKKVGSVATVLVDGAEDEWAVARLPADAPEVDPVLRFADPRGTWSTGSMPRVRITAADGYDLVGEVIR